MTKDYTEVNGFTIMGSDLTAVMREVICGMVKGKKVAVAFSGGLDSGIVASIIKEYADSVVLYTVGIENAYDVNESREVSQILGLEWHHLLVNEDNLVPSLRDMVSITGTVNPITLSFEIPLYYVSKNCKEDIIIGGQGADELFAGYSKYIGLSEDELEDMREADMATLFNTTLQHERKVSEHFGKKVLYPYLDSKVTDLVGRMDMEDLIPGEVRKQALRTVAEEIGQPVVAAKKKKAAQYGSGAMNLLRKIAKNNGETVGDMVNRMYSEQ